MAISVSCPSCERELKVKDELAGRKVKCPKCGKGVVVPGDDEDEEKVAAGPSRKASRQEEDEEEERPRKKKKKKKKSNNNLLILSGLGGVLLLGVVVVVIILSNRKDQPTRKAEPPPAEEVKGVPPPVAEREPEKGRYAGPGGQGDRQLLQNDFKQLGLWWNNYATQGTRPNVQTFQKTFLPKQPGSVGVVEAITNRKIRFVPTAPPGSGILAYEWPADTSGQHIIVRADGSVHTILTTELRDEVPTAGK